MKMLAARAFSFALLLGTGCVAVPLVVNSGSVAANKMKGESPEVKARREKFAAAYEQALSGDKLRIMREEILVNAVVYAEDPPRFTEAFYGEGKKLLETPEDFAKAKIWANTGYAYPTDDANKQNPRWYLDIRRFEGMKLLKQDALRGPGTTAPTELFK